MAEIKCPCGLRNYMEEEDCKKTNCNACCPLTKPQTNADRIRAMSDEELAKFIPDWSYTNACKCDEQPYVDCNNECEKCVLEWLKQPAETPTNADRCVSCGAIIPEGTMVCTNCHGAKEG